LEKTSPTPGAQSLRRSLQLLRLLGEHQQQGLRMSDAIRLTGLERSTAHRMLSCLVEEQFAEKDPATKLYRLGFEALQLGSAAERKMPLVGGFRPLMTRLARISGDTVFLVARDGDDVICLHREEGPHPIKAFTINTGDRRKIGVGAGGMALLAALDDAEIETIFQRNRPLYQSVGLDRNALWRGVMMGRKVGYHRMVDRTAEGVAGVGAVVPDESRVRVAVSIGTVTARLNATRCAELGSLLVSSLSQLTGIEFLQ
jgi:DNA-binding IclR family transcriptional regulator